MSNLKLIERKYTENGHRYSETDTNMLKEVSERGLGYVDFLDKSHQVCVLQDSSLADEPAIRIGIVNSGPYTPGPTGQINEIVPYGTMHLTKAMVKTLLPFFEEFVKNETSVAEMEIQDNQFVRKEKD